jgi:hypothetical protein
MIKKPDKRPSGRQRKKRKKTRAEKDRFVAEQHKEKMLERVKEKIDGILKEVADKSKTRQEAEDFLNAQVRQEKRYLAMWKGEQVKNMTAEEKMTARRAAEERRQMSAFFKVAPAFYQEAINLYLEAIRKIRFKLE